jgi:ornithine decarboxylase
VRQYSIITAAFGAESVHYAVKANPHPELVGELVRAGSRFDVASPAELDLCVQAGADASRVIYSHPMKRRADIDHAYRHGVQLFAADSSAEIDKLAEAAPGAAVLVRLATTGAGSNWPLSGKFGCAAAEVVPLVRHAGSRGLLPAGVTFHVGSQQCDPRAWDAPIRVAAGIFDALRVVGLRPWLLDLGGGLPAGHEGGHPGLDAYRDAIFDSLDRHFGSSHPRLVIEPGRAVVGDAGQLVTRVIGVSWRGGRRWVYLDAGVYTGLVETLGEAIRYRLCTTRDADPVLGPAVLAGPTCDSVDVLYEKTPVLLPLTLAEGDLITFASAGAYTATYSTVGFNGFAPLPTVLQ